MPRPGALRTVRRRLGPGTLLIDPGAQNWSASWSGVGWLGHGVDWGGVRHMVETPGRGGC